MEASQNYGHCGWPKAGVPPDPSGNVLKRELASMMYPL